MGERHEAFDGFANRGEPRRRIGGNHAAASAAAEEAAARAADEAAAFADLVARLGIPGATCVQDAVARLGVTDALGETRSRDVLAAIDAGEARIIDGSAYMLMRIDQYGIGVARIYPEGSMDVVWRSEAPTYSADHTPALAALAAL